MADLGKIVVSMDTRPLAEVIHRLEAAVAASRPAASSLPALAATAAVASASTRKITRRCLLWPFRRRA